MATSAPGTPRSNLTTPRRLGTKSSAVTQTPECFNRVLMETPVNAKKSRHSKDKLDEYSNLTVAVRIRPVNSKELACVGAGDVVSVKNQDLLIRSSPVGNAGVSVDHIFQYDHILWSCDEYSPLYANQEDVFFTLGQPLLNSAFKGYNACLFAYGQTGSGKSYSMMGRHFSDYIDIDSEEHSGITPRFCRELFSRIGKLQDTIVSVEVSYFEIYNEKIHDLLADTGLNNRTPLKVREHPEWGPYVVDLSVHNVKTYEELRQWLILGNKNRATAATVMNENSSRSHSIFAIELCLSDGSTETDSSRRSKVSLVDLAGSERLGTSYSNEEKMKQGVSINKSLLTLGKVILALAEQKKNSFVPYRESVLTWLLKESLGGNSLTSMLATISPANTHIDETLATLRYACQARSIVNRARINESPHDRLIRELRAEVERLRALRKDYERNSLSAAISLDETNTHMQQLEDLKSKLSHTESQLLEAETSWRQRFMEMRQTQLKELADAEKRKEELESHVRILETLDVNIDVQLVGTNFLEAVDGLLGEELGNKENEWDCLRRLRNKCLRVGRDLEFAVVSEGTISIMDCRTGKTTFCTLESIKCISEAENVVSSLEKLVWTDCTKAGKKLSKSQVMSSMNQIYQALSALKPMLDEEDGLRFLFAKVNKSLQSFESALMNSVSKSSSATKTVTFKV